MGSFKLSSTFAFICILANIASYINPVSAQNSPQDYIHAHNVARTQTGADLPPMSWNETLERYAQEYANGVLNANTCDTLVHSQGPYGENLAAGYPDMTGLEGIKLWVDEKADYHHEDNSCNEGKVCGHYTQVVWKNSVQLGCARVHCPNTWAYIICSYYPPGNYIGESPY